MAMIGKTQYQLVIPGLILAAENTTNSRKVLLSFRHYTVRLQKINVFMSQQYSAPYVYIAPQ
jgi:hypothetical protein